MRKEAEVVSETPVKLWLRHHPTRNNLTEGKIMKKFCFLLVFSSSRMQHQSKYHQLLKGLKIIRWEKHHIATSPPPIQAATPRISQLLNKMQTILFYSWQWGLRHPALLQLLEPPGTTFSLSASLKKKITFISHLNLTNSYYKLEIVKAMACEILAWKSWLVCW